MAVKVLITRRFKKDKIDKAHEVLMELRSLATVRKGYVSGQTLISEDDPYKLVVVSTWASRKRWQDWQADPIRKEFEGRMQEYLEKPEENEVFLVGDKLPEWVDMA